MYRRVLLGSCRLYLPGNKRWCSPPSIASFSTQVSTFATASGGNPWAGDCTNFGSAVCSLVGALNLSRHNVSYCACSAPFTAAIRSRCYPVMTRGEILLPKGRSAKFRKRGNSSPTGKEIYNETHNDQGPISHICTSRRSRVGRCVVESRDLRALRDSF